MKRKSPTLSGFRFSSSEEIRVRVSVHSVSERRKRISLCVVEQRNLVCCRRIVGRIVSSQACLAHIVCVSHHPFVRAGLRNLLCAGLRSRGGGRGVLGTRPGREQEEREGERRKSGEGEMADVSLDEIFLEAAGRAKSGGWGKKRQAPTHDWSSLDRIDSNPNYDDFGEGGGRRAGSMRKANTSKMPLKKM